MDYAVLTGSFLMVAFIGAVIAAIVYKLLKRESPRAAWFIAGIAVLFLSFGSRSIYLVLATGFTFFLFLLFSAFKIKIPRFS